MKFSRKISVHTKYAFEENSISVRIFRAKKCRTKYFNRLSFSLIKEETMKKKIVAHTEWQWGLYILYMSKGEARCQNEKVAIN